MSKKRHGNYRGVCKRGHKRTPDNVDAYNNCRQCCREKYWSNKKAILKRMRAFKKAHPTREMFTDARGRAKKGGYPFDLIESDIVIPEFCPVLGIRLSRSRGKPSACSPSLDKIDRTKGYVKGNVWVISFRANTIKNDSTLDEMKKLVEALENRLGTT